MMTREFTAVPQLQRKVRRLKAINADLMQALRFNLAHAEEGLVDRKEARQDLKDIAETARTAIARATGEDP